MEQQIKTLSLYPGISLSFLNLHSAPLSVSHEPLGHILQVSYCLEGRIGWHMKNGSSVYLGPRDFSVHSMRVCTGSVMSVPNDFYRGIILCMDLERLEREPPEPLKGIKLRKETLYRALYNAFCTDDSISSYAGNEETEPIFSAFFDCPPELQEACWKIKSLELLLYLARIKDMPHKQLTEYQSEQVEIIRKVHEALVCDLSQRLTIEQLSKEYLMNPTTLKKVFKDVYGNSLATHIKEHRMEQAARLLLETDQTIIQISKAVGYDTQSKFTAAFKESFHTLPTEYRKQHKKRLPADAGGAGNSKTGRK